MIHNWFCYRFMFLFANLHVLCPSTLLQQHSNSPTKINFLFRPTIAPNLQLKIPFSLSTMPIMRKEVASSGIMFPIFWQSFHHSQRQRKLELPPCSTAKAKWQFISLDRLWENTQVAVDLEDISPFTSPQLPASEIRLFSLPIANSKNSKNL